MLMGPFIRVCESGLHIFVFCMQQLFMRHTIHSNIHGLGFELCINEKVLFILLQKLYEK